MSKELEKRDLVQAVFEMEDTRADKGDDSSLKLTGYAAVFEKLSVPMWGFKEKIQRGAFSKSLTTNNVKSLWNHNTDFVLGSTNSKTLVLEEDEKGLRFELTLPDTQAGRDAYTLIKRGDVNQMSFGFRVKGQIWDESDPKNVIRTLTEIDLHEISPTPFPAYKQTSAKVRSIQEDYDHFKSESNNSDTERRKNELALKIKILDLEL